MKVERDEVPHVWVAEVAYKSSRWITLWTTCRLTRDDCRSALENHAQAHDDGYHIQRIRKFTRGTQEGSSK